MRKLRFEVSTFVKTVAFVVFVCGRLVGVAFADDSTGNPSPRENRTAFALSVFHNVAEDAAERANVVVSPLGLQRVLDAASIGADGTTKAEIDLAIRRTEPEEVWTANAASLYKHLNEDSETKLAGTIWLQKDFKPNADYVDRLAALSGQSVESVDFSIPGAALKTINDRFARETNGLIDESLKEISPETRAVVADVVAFHGEWKTKFDPKNTTDRPFTGLDGKESSVPTMSLSRGLLRYASSQEDGIQYLEIPYKDGRYSLALVLPDSPERYRKFEKELELGAGATWASKLANLRKNARFQEVRLFLPKFEVKFASDYVKTLGKMGISAAFQPNADFSRFSNEKIFINQAFQSARLIVDENGTEAAAATALGMALGIPQEPILVDVNRPFFYLIYRNPENRNARAYYESGFFGGMGEGMRNAGTSPKRRAQKKGGEENVDEAILFCGRVVKL